jgi:polyhydroxybutyrate depolymerase
MSSGDVWCVHLSLIEERSAANKAPRNAFEWDQLGKLFQKRMIRRTLKLVLLAMLALAPRLPAQTETRAFVHNGYIRPYVIHRPERLAAHPAVVFMLGGIRSTAKSASQEFHWIDEADRNGFLVVFPEPVATIPDQLADRQNVTFWEMKGSRTHRPATGALPVDDDGYLMAVLADVLRRDHADRRSVFFAGFSSGSGAVQLLASRHPRKIHGIVGVATPLMDPPAKLVRPVPILYIHGDQDEQFTAFEVNSPHFATTPHGNWVTWGYLNGCKIQGAEKTAWGVQLSWQDCRDGVPVIADFVANLGHEWAGSLNSAGKKERPEVALDFTEMAWQFFAAIHSR